MLDARSRAANDDTPVVPIEQRWTDAARALANAIWNGKPHGDLIRTLMLLRGEEAAKRRRL